MSLLGTRGNSSGAEARPRLRATDAGLGIACPSVHPGACQAPATPRPRPPAGHAHPRPRLCREHRFELSSLRNCRCRKSCKDRAGIQCRDSTPIWRPFAREVSPPQAGRERGTRNPSRAPAAQRPVSDLHGASCLPGRAARARWTQRPGRGDPKEDPKEGGGARDVYGGKFFTVMLSHSPPLLAEDDRSVLVTFHPGVCPLPAPSRNCGSQGSSQR